MVTNLRLLQSAETFEQLFNRTESLSIKGIGEMAIYDTAYRIGAKLGLEPRLIVIR